MEFNKVLTLPNGKKVNFYYELIQDDQPIIVKFNFELNYAEKWDISFITLTFFDGVVSVVTERGSNLKDTPMVGLLWNVVAQEISDILWSKLTHDEKNQIERLSFNGLLEAGENNLAGRTIYNYTADYNGNSYIVHFTKLPGNIPNDDKWEISNIQKVFPL